MQIILVSSQGVIFSPADQSTPVTSSADIRDLQTQEPGGGLSYANIVLTLIRGLYLQLTNMMFLDWASFLQLS
jgi:hypothetical protein